MSAPMIKFKRVSLNRVILAKTSPDYVTVYWAKYFHDDGTLAFEERLNFNEAAKLVAKDNLTDKLNSL